MSDQPNLDAAVERVTFGPDAANSNNRRMFVDGHQWAKVYGWDTASVEARCAELEQAFAALSASSARAEAAEEALRDARRWLRLSRRNDNPHLAEIDAFLDRTTLASMKGEG